MTDEEIREAERLANEMVADKDVYRRLIDDEREGIRLGYAAACGMKGVECEIERARSAKLLEALRNVEPRLKELANYLKDKGVADEKIGNAEHDACLIAIGYLNLKEVIAEYELTHG